MDRFNFKISQNVTHTESEEGASLKKKQGRLREVGVTCLQKLWFQQSWPIFPHSPILYYAQRSWIKKTMTKARLVFWTTTLFLNAVTLIGNLSPNLYLMLPLFKTYLEESKFAVYWIRLRPKMNTTITIFNTSKPCYRLRAKVIGNVK